MLEYFNTFYENGHVNMVVEEKEERSPMTFKNLKPKKGSKTHTSVPQKHQYALLSIPYLHIINQGPVHLISPKYISTSFRRKTFGTDQTSFTQVTKCRMR